MSVTCARTAEGEKYINHMKMTAVKMKFLSSINLKELALEIISCQGCPIELELGGELLIAGSSLEKVVEAETILQDLFCQRKYCIDINRFGCYEWQLLKQWLNCILRDSGKRVAADIFQNGDTGSFEIVLVGFKDFFSDAEAKILDFLHGLEWTTESLSLGSAELLLVRNLQGNINLSLFQVELEISFDLKNPAILFHGPRRNISRAKVLLQECIHLKAVSRVSVETKQMSLALCLCKRGSDHLQHADALICPMKNGRCSNVSKKRNSCHGEREISRLGGLVRPAISISIYTQISPVGKPQRVITMGAMLALSDRNPDGIELCFREALRTTLDYSERQGFSSLAIVSPQMEDHFIAEADFTTSVVNVLQHYSQGPSSMSLKKVFFISDEDSVLKENESPQRDPYPGIGGKESIVIEIAESALISQETVHAVVLLVPINQDGMLAIDAPSLLGKDGGALDCLCELIPTMRELITGNPVVLPVQPYTKLRFPYLVLLGFPILDDLCESTEKALANATRSCLEMCEKSLLKSVTLHIPDLAQESVSAIDSIRIVTETVAQFETHHHPLMIKKIRLLLHPGRITSVAAQNIEKPLENLGMYVTEDHLFVQYLTECSIAREDICSKMERFGGKVTVCPESNCLFIGPMTLRKSSEWEVMMWTQTMQAALEIIKQEYIVHSEGNTSLAALLDKNKQSLLDQFKSIIFFNQIALVGHRQEVKELLDCLKELAFKKEPLKRGLMICNMTSSIIVTTYLKKELASRYPGLRIYLDNARVEVLLEGPREEVLAAEERYSNILHGLLYADVQLTKNQVSFLKGINLDTFNEDVFFSKERLVGLIYNDGEFKLLGINTEEFLGANNSLQNNIPEYDIVIPARIQAVLYSAEWPNFINGLQRKLNKEDIKTVDILTFQNEICSHVVVVGRQTAALKAKEALEEYLHFIEVFNLKTPGAWQYLADEGRTWLENTTGDLSCVVETQAGEMYSLLNDDSPDTFIKAPSSILSIEIQSAIVTSIADVETDAVVCPMSFDIDLKSNPFSIAITALTGAGIKLSQDFLPPGEVMVCSPSDMCHQILFVNFLPYQDRQAKEEEGEAEGQATPLTRGTTSEARHHPSGPEYPWWEEPEPSRVHDKPATPRQAARQGEPFKTYRLRRLGNNGETEGSQRTSRLQSSALTSSQTYIYL